MQFLIPIIAGILFRLGGDGRFPFLFIKGWNAKWWRWLGIGLLVGSYYAIARHSFIPLISVASYYLATSALPYGDNSWLNKFVSREVKWVIYGLVFGLASCPIFISKLVISVIQAGIGAISFYTLMRLSNDGVTLKNKVYKLDHKWVELGFGFFGTITLGV